MDKVIQIGTPVCKNTSIGETKGVEVKASAPEATPKKVEQTAKNTKKRK